MSGYKLLNDRPVKSNDIYSIFEAVNENGEKFYAKIFSLDKIQNYNLQETLQYNQEVFSDLDGNMFPEHFNKIIASIPNEGFFTYITEPYDITLQEYMRKTRVTQAQALRIFDQVLKAVYSVYSNGYWHKNIRPEHFVRSGNLWKLDSLVYCDNLKSDQNSKSQYIFDSTYQPPEMYEKNMKALSDSDHFPVVVWNLGSLLLDLFFSVHKLSSYDILKLYKNQKFTLEGIRVKKTDIFSKKLKDIFEQMLHYDPKSRMKLQEVFSNEILSKQVSKSYKQKNKNKSFFGSINFRIFTGGKSALNSARFSQQLRQKGDKQLHISQIIKSKVNRKEKIQNIPVQTVSKDEQNLFGSLNSFENICKAKIKIIKSIFIKQTITIENISKNKQFQSLIKKYKLQYDKSQILIEAGSKFALINYQINSQQTINLSKFAVSFVALNNLNNLCQCLIQQKHQKQFNIDTNNNFQNSSQFKLLKKIICKKIQQIQKDLQRLKEKLKNMNQNEKALLKQLQIQNFISSDPKSTQFSSIKSIYRKIIKVSYDLITRIFNSENNIETARLALYIVYCLAIDKIYLSNNIEKNFSYYFEWLKQEPSQCVTFQKFKQYVKGACVKTLISHARMILEKYFKI